MAANAPWRSLGSLLELLKRPGRAKGGFQGRMGRSWMPLGALLEAFGPPQKVIGNGSWTARGHRGDWFQLSWGSKMGPGEWSKKGPKTGPRLRTAKP